jgi:hypothetical protein
MKNEQVLLEVKVENKQVLHGVKEERNIPHTIK